MDEDVISPLVIITRVVMITQVVIYFLLHHFTTQELPIVAKLFTLSVRCPQCGQANDSDFRFCQKCGYRRKVLVKSQATHADMTWTVLTADSASLLCLTKRLTTVSKRIPYRKNLCHSSFPFLDL